MPLDDDNENDYWSFLQDYNWRAEPFVTLTWEDGDKPGEFEYNNNPTFGYWHDYYDEIETSASALDFTASTYSDKTEKKENSCLIPVEGHYFIFMVPHGTPAFNAGLQFGDIITFISKNINAAGGVILKVKRKEEEFEVNIDINSNERRF